MTAAASTEKKAEPVKEEAKPAPKPAAAAEPAAPKPAASKPKPASKATKKEAEKAVEKAAEKSNAVSNDLQNVDDEIVQDMYGKEHLNIVFMGHVGMCVCQNGYSMETNMMIFQMLVNRPWVVTSCS